VEATTCGRLTPVQWRVWRVRRAPRTRFSDHHKKLRDAHYLAARRQADVMAERPEPDGTSIEIRVWEAPSPLMIAPLRQDAGRRPSSSGSALAQIITVGPLLSMPMRNQQEDRACEKAGTSLRHRGSKIISPCVLCPPYSSVRRYAAKGWRLVARR